MKKAIFFVYILVSLTATSHSQSLYELSFKQANGDSVRLGDYKGKKILFILVPMKAQDSVINQLTAFKNRYGDTVTVIGILSYEDGFKQQQQAALSSQYSNMGILLCEGIRTRKSAGSAQAALMQWLTDVKKNRHFNNDASGIGQKFFVNESGRLFAVLGPKTSLQSPIIDRIVHSNPN